jgi:hypothetical protein
VEPDGGLVILVPLLGRADRFGAMAASAAATMPTARVLYCVTPGDTPVLDALNAVGAQRILVPWQPVGDYARKINTGYACSSEALLFLGADDIVFHPGWFEAATAQLTAGVGVVGTNDLGSPRVMAGLHSTHSLVTRSYVDTYGTIDEPGKVLHEGYLHEYVDDEFVETARRRGAYAHAADSWVEHYHANWGKATVDSLYQAQRMRMRAGRPIYQARRALWT